MITNIKVKNFKALKEAVITLSNLNVLTGINGMGKSSLIQLFLLLRQSNSLKNGRVELNDKDLISLGKGKDVFYQYGEDPYIYLDITDSSGSSLNWKFSYSSEGEYLLADSSYGEKDFSKFSFLSENFQYLNAERIGPRSTYSTSAYDIERLEQIGNKGEFAVHFLNVFGNSKKIADDLLLHPKRKTNNYISQVEAWLGEISPGTKLNTTSVPGTEIVLLDYQFETGRDLTNRFRPINVGFGISYVLPVILSLLQAKAGRMIIIENPEAHLHPRGQAEMGKLISLAASTGAQIFIETHSDHILNGIRVATKNGKINSKNIQFLFFDKITSEYEQYASITPIRVDKNGELSNYPKNFLDEWNNQLFKLM